MHKLVLNAIPIQIADASSVVVGVHPYDPLLLANLRQQYAGKYFFRRSGESGSEIHSVPLLEGLPLLSADSVTIDLLRDHRMVASLATEALLRTFLHLGRSIIRPGGPLRVLSERPGNLIPTDPSLPSWLQRRVVLNFDTRTLWNVENKPQSVMVCTIRTRNVIDVDCQELLSQNISVLGKYVGVKLPAKDSRVADSFDIRGRVARVENDTFILEDHGNHSERLYVKEAFLEPRKENINWCISELTGGRAENIIEKTEIAATDYHSGAQRLDFVQKTFAYLRSKQIEILPNIALQFGQLISQEGGNWKLRTETIPKPVLVFDPSGTRTDRWNERGLDQNGPYDGRSFTPKQLRIAVVCQAPYEGQVDAFMAKFLDGLPDVKIGTGEWARAPYAKGFVRRFALESAKITVFVSRGPKSEDYASACRAAVADATTGGFEWTLAIVQIDKDFRNLEDQLNPYFTTKAIFLKHRIPVQEVTLETINFSNNQLVYVLNNISIAVYAKIGGTPWLLKSQPRGAHELVIGIGSQNLSPDRLGSQQRVVGLTTVFSSDGNYLLDDMTAAVDYDNYATALLETLKRSIDTVRKMDNWRNSDDVRLIFHVFKEMADSEAEAVIKLVQHLGLTHVKYAFLHVIDQHPFALFDEGNLGTRTKSGLKGVYAPERGLSVQIGERESLLCFTGGRDLKQVKDGHPLPTLLRLHRQSTFKDLTYLTRQAFEFSCHSWRMLTPAPQPITIHYSELMARLLGGLRNVSNWDPDTMLGPVSRTRWFL